MPTKVNLEITKHAAQRMSQRGITNGFLNALIAHADIETPIYGGATALCVSMHQSRALNLNDRLHHYAVVLSAQSTILTVLKMVKGRKGTRYRRRTWSEEKMVKNQDSRASLKQEQAKQRRDRLLDEIDQLCTHGRKHLATRQRLQAAHFIREQVDNLICHSHPKWKISDIETELKNRKLAGIRLHRWMVKAPQGSITDELVGKYENRPEPLKKTRVYFKIAEVLARLSEKDPGDTKIALYKRTNLDAQFAPIVRKDGDEEIDPTARLLQLLRNATNDIAHRADLAGLFQKAERLQAGVSSQNFNEVKTLRNVLQPYTRQTLVAGFWAMDAVPALPSVHLAEYPIAEARNLDFLFRTGEAGTKTRGGDVALTWSLRMAIAPDANHAAEPMIIRTTRLFFIDNCNSTEQLEIHHSGDGFEDLLPVSKWRPFLINEPTTSVSFTRDAAEKFEVIASHRNFYRRSYPDENLPHEDIRCAEIEPLDRFQLQRWFCNGGAREDHEICRGRVLWPLQNGSQDKAAEWFTSPGMARDLELAIRNGQLRDDFLQAIKALERSTNRLATQRLEEMKERDRDLFDQWSAERFALDSQDRLETEREADMSSAVFITFKNIRLNIEWSGGGLPVNALPTKPGVYAEIYRPERGVRIGETGRSIRGKIKHDIRWFRSMGDGTAPEAQLRRTLPIAEAAKKTGDVGFAYFVVSCDNRLEDKELRQACERHLFEWVRQQPNWVDWNRQRSWR